MNDSNASFNQYGNQSESKLLEEQGQDNDDLRRELEDTKILLLNTEEELELKISENNKLFDKADHISEALQNNEKEVRKLQKLLKGYKTILEEKDDEIENQMKNDTQHEIQLQTENKDQSKRENEQNLEIKKQTAKIGDLTAKNQLLCKEYLLNFNYLQDYSMRT